ncbi:MAG: ABC transporter substrate-binding protein [Nakamurella sp.]
MVFSLQRVQGIAGNPAFLLDGVKIVKTDDNTITLTSPSSNPQLPFILPNPSLGIVNSKVVKANGGSTTTKDGAEQFINNHSQGSGPYMIDTYDATSKVVLKANPHYSGTAPVYARVVLENVESATQNVNINAGTTQIATDLSPQQLKALDPAKVKVLVGEATQTDYLWFNLTPQFGKQSANVKFVQAMRHAVNYPELLSLAGQGAKQPGGMVPLGFLGALDKDPNNSYDVTKAKALLAESGYKGEPISVQYANDVSFGGVPVDQFAQAIQAEVKKVGINIKLSPLPSATTLDAFRSGKAQAGIASWGADYPDPADYLVFAPGQDLAKRAAWTAAMAPESDKLAKAAAAASGDQARDSAYIKFQQQLNIDGPFIPFLEPPDNTAYSASLKNVQTNPLLGLNISAIT